MTRRTLLVTGGGSGIGAATARLASMAGYRVALHCHPSRREEAERVAAEAASDAIVIPADLRDPVAIAEMFARVSDGFGALDALVNAAGVDMAPTPVEQLQAEQVKAILEVNVVGLMLCCREGVLRMSKHHGGRGGVIVNVSSMAASVGGRPGYAAYAASKAAVDCFTIGLAREVAPARIRAVSVRPGVVRTPMTQHLLALPEFQTAVAASIPLGRCAEPDEIAGPILFALSDAASFLSGCTLDLSGGGFNLAR